MATAKTGSFYLTETVAFTSGTSSGDRVLGSIDLGAYVSVAQGLAIAVESVDFVWQDNNFSGNIPGRLSANGTVTAQLTDLNPGTSFVRADNQSLVASGTLTVDKVNNVVSQSSDLYPDNFGPAAVSEAFMVVNDTMYLMSGPDGADYLGTAYLTARIRCRVVKLGSKDWMAIAIQSTASDN
tara:strand:+ start:37 stop:582 length:546 start_codon:yes stop_codon:yes gene_type:complete